MGYVRHALATEGLSRQTGTRCETGGMEDWRPSFNRRGMARKRFMGRGGAVSLPPACEEGNGPEVLPPCRNLAASASLASTYVTANLGIAGASPGSLNRDDTAATGDIALAA